MSNEEDLHELASDQPIQRPGQDKFRRDTFARQLADGIARRKGRHSSVVALQGAWGSGKTSVKNLVLAELKSDQEQGKVSPHLVEFEPWQLRDADSLFSAFFKEISIVIGADTKGGDDKKDRLLRYSKALTLGGTAAKWIGVAVNLAGVPGAAAFGQAVNERAKDFSEVFKEGSEATDNEPQQSLRQLKDELKKLMGDLERPVLVVIDDIDRLEVEEMLLIFQLVKANADFPNFTYLLLMQRDAVQKALVDRLGEHGRDYLDKIIQQPLDVPPANVAQRYKLFRENLEELLTSWKVALSDDMKSDLDLLWKNGFGAMLQTPRDVVRLLNALEFSLGVMKGDAGLEVNLADFVALEVLRVAEPATYARLPMVKVLLTGFRPAKNNEHNKYAHVLGNAELKDDEQPGQVEMDEVLKNLSSSRSQAARLLLAFVFPLSSWALKPRKQEDLEPTQSRPSSPTRANKRTHFDRYFALAIPEDQISEAEIKDLLSVVGDEVALQNQLEGFDARGLLQLLLLEIVERFSQIPPQHLVVCLSTLLDYCESKSEQATVLEMTLFLVFRQLLVEMPLPQERGDLLEQVLERSHAFGIPTLWVSREEKKTLPLAGYFNPDQWTTDAKLQELRALLTRRIAARADKAEFFQAPFVSHAVFFWSQTDLDAVRSWVKIQMASDEQLHRLLQKFHNTDFREIFNWLEDAAQVKARVEALDTSNWQDVDRNTAQRFISQAQQWIQQQEQERQNQDPGNSTVPTEEATS